MTVYDDGGTALGGVNQTTRTFIVKVLQPNLPPIAISASFNATEDGGPVTTEFLADDVDSDDGAGTLSYTLVSPPSEGSVTSNGNGTFTFDPAGAFQDLAVGQARQVTFSFKATDSHEAESSVQTVTVTVTGVNDADGHGPVAALGSETTRPLS